MDIKHLGYILEAYKCRSVNKAAQNVFISQPHLSSIIKGVENEVGYQIFNRTPSGLIATPQGRYFLENVEKIVNGWEGILSAPAYFQDSGALSVCSTPSSFAFQCFLEYRRRFPADCCDTFLEGGLRETMKRIVDQQCSIGILTTLEHQIPKYKQLADNYKLDFLKLKKGITMQVYMYADHPLARAETVLKADLIQYPLVTDINLDKDDRIKFTDKPSNILYVSDRGTSYDAVRKGGCLLAGLMDPTDMEILGCVSKPIIDAEKLAFCYIKPHLLEINSRERQFLEFFGGVLKRLN